MTDLFASSPLEQDTGLLRERWNQEGSTVVNIAVGKTGNSTVYTVSAGKVLYITSVSVTTDTNGEFSLNDSNGGSAKFRTFITTSAALGVHFSTPLKFSTSVYFTKLGVAIDADLTLTGWEESA